MDALIEDPYHSL